MFYKTLHPTNIGFIPTGTANGVPNESTFVMGRQQGNTWEAMGFGKDGRPDELQIVQINITRQDTHTQIGTVTIDVADFISLIAGGAPNPLELTLTEIDVCDAGVAKKMVVLASPTY